MPYSYRFIGIEGSATVIQYVVPAGHRAIVKSADMINTSGVAGLAAVSLAGIDLLFNSALAPNAAEHWYGHHVLMAGEAIAGYGAAAGINVLVSGFLLHDP